MSRPCSCEQEINCRIDGLEFTMSKKCTEEEKNKKVQIQY